MKLDDRFLDQLKSRLVLSDIVGERVKLSKKGRDMTGLCPFHREKTPSFIVHNDEGYYHCFGCGVSGNAISFIMEIRGLRFMEAVEELASRAGMQMPKIDEKDQAKWDENDKLYEVMNLAAEWFANELFQPIAAPAQLYLEGRGLTPNWVKDLKLGYSPAGKGRLTEYLKNKGFSEQQMLKAGLLGKGEDGRIYERFRDRIMFPIHDQRDRVIGFGGRTMGDGEPKYLNSPETPLFHKGRALYGYSYARRHKGKNDPIIVAEGYMDVISLRMAGYPGSVAPLGTAMTEDQIELLWRLSNYPILCFDGDQAGINAAKKAAFRALPLLKPGHSLNFVYLPESQDPDSMIRNSGKVAFDKFINTPKPLVDVLWESLIEGKNLQAPEQLSLLQQEMKTTVGNVSDKIIADGIKQILWDKFNALRKKKFKPITGIVKIKMPNNVIDKNIQQLLEIILHNPHILEEVCEELGNIEIENPGFNRVRESMLSFMSMAYSTETAINLSDYLIQHGFGNFVKNSKGNLGLNPADAKSRWDQVLEGLNKQALQKEIFELQKLLANDMSESNWKRLCELKKML